MFKILPQQLREVSTTIQLDSECSNWQLITLFLKAFTWKAYRSATIRINAYNDSCKRNVLTTTMFLNFCPMLLVLASFASTFYSASAADFKVTYNTAKDSCAQAGDTNQGTLRVKRIWTVFYDKQTKIVNNIKVASVKHDAIRGSASIKYNGTMTNLRVGLYVLVIRTTKIRENENPESNVLQMSKTQWGGGRLSNPGVGLDFSEMYFESPFALKVDIVELTKAGEVDRGSYTLNQCWDDKKWIANEGLYKLNVVNGKWYPVYYNPMNADFYYEYD
ncbi:unnamed protein product [Haemonchus placei]|uniref:M1 family peptidase n=1 Tax=Haemonchus placei TaxID=6290 RepID=A0A0N4X483_HAEPC|nr:unnamed protein product [Haemonchus placei]